jgi:cell division protease FtsH
MAMLLGGRSAEELVFAEITTGASDDIERCTDIARGMVTQYGMSDKLGPQQFGKERGEVFLGRDMNHEANYSPEVAGIVDAEVRLLIDTAHDRARAILAAHRSTLDRLARSLIEKETLEDADLAEIFGPLDKGTGIDLTDPTPTDIPAPIEPELVGVASGATVAETQPVHDPVPAPVPVAPETAPARRWWRRRVVRSPRPSGT